MSVEFRCALDALESLGFAFGSGFATYEEGKIIASLCAAQPFAMKDSEKNALPLLSLLKSYRPSTICKSPFKKKSVVSKNPYLVDSNYSRSSSRVQEHFVMSTSPAYHSRWLAVCMCVFLTFTKSKMHVSLTGNKPKF